MDDLQKIELIIRLLLHGLLIGTILASVIVWIHEPSHTVTHYALAILSGGVILYYNYRLHRAIFRRLEARRQRQNAIAQETNRIEQFLQNDLKRPNSSDLQKLIDEMQPKLYLSTINKGCLARLEAHLNKANKLLEEKQHEENIFELNRKKDNLEKEISSLEHQKMCEETTDEEKTEQLRDNLDLPNNPVYLRKGLIDQEIAILQKEGYHQFNEYDITTQSIITVLVKPVLNHSSTHTFLVWSAKRFLETLPVKEVKEHLTKDADITFKHNNKTYALEIETGNLLKKNHQLAAKVAYLSQKYKNHWLFVVSNKNLVSKYNKYGPATHRKGVAKNIQTLLNFATREKRVKIELSDDKLMYFPR